MTTPSDSVPLLERTLYLVNNAPRSITFAEMARQIDVSPSWVSAFAKDLIPDPGVRKVQALHDYLSGLQI
jgi:hypothetical protein